MIKDFFACFLDEFYQRLGKPSTYFLLAFFLLLVGGSWLYPWDVTHPLSPQNFWKNFFLPALFVLPCLLPPQFSTKRTPCRPNSTVAFLANFCVSYLLYLAFWCTSLLFPYLANTVLPTPIAANFFSDALSLNGCFFLFTSSFLFLSIGMFAKSLAIRKNLTILLSFCFFFIFIHTTNDISQWKYYQQSDIAFCNIFETLDAFLQGNIDIRAILFQVISGILFLLLAYVLAKNSQDSQTSCPHNSFRCWHRSLQIFLLVLLFIGLPITLQDYPYFIETNTSTGKTFTPEVQTFLQNQQPPFSLYVLTDEEPLPKNFYHPLYGYLHRTKQYSHKNFSWHVNIIYPDCASQKAILQKRYHFEGNTGVLLVAKEKSLWIPLSTFQNFSEESFLQTLATFQLPIEEKQEEQPSIFATTSIPSSDFQTLFYWFSAIPITFLLIGILRMAIRKK